MRPISRGAGASEKAADPTGAERPKDGSPFPVRVVPERLAEARGIAEEVIRWVERADAKATVLITGIGVIFGGEVLVLIEIVKLETVRIGSRWIALAFLIASMIFLLASGALATLAVYPRLGRPYVYRSVAEPGDLLFFGRLKAVPPGEFVKEFDRALAEGRLIEHYAEQIHFNANVAWTKYAQIRWSLKVFGLAACFALAAVVAFAIVAANA
jgi:hypothetical protein